MMTRSGVLVMPDNREAPPLCDIALGLARQPRFGGHTIDPWSVAEHSMVVALIARWWGTPAATVGMLAELHGLIHDAHESVTGDVPSSWKTNELKRMQQALDLRIFASLGIDPPNVIVDDLIHRCDRASLLAEAKLLAAPGVYAAIRAGSGFGGVPQPEAHEDALNAVVTIKRYKFTAETAASHYYTWTKRLAEKWRVRVAA